MDEQMILKQISAFQTSYNDSTTLNGNIQELRSTDETCREVRVFNPLTNSNKIYIGFEGLTPTNYTIFLEIGEGVNISINNVKRIKVIGTNTETVNYSWIK